MCCRTNLLRSFDELSIYSVDYLKKYEIALENTSACRLECLDSIVLSPTSLQAAVLIQSVDMVPLSPLNTSSLGGLLLAPGLKIVLSQELFVHYWVLAAPNYAATAAIAACRSRLHEIRYEYEAARALPLPLS